MSADRAPPGAKIRLLGDDAATPHSAREELEQRLTERETELRIARDEVGRAHDERRRLADAAEAARQVSAAEAQRRLDADDALESMHDALLAAEAGADAAHARAAEAETRTFAAQSRATLAETRTASAEARREEHAARVRTLEGWLAEMRTQLEAARSRLRAAEVARLQLAAHLDAVEAERGAAERALVDVENSLAFAAVKNLRGVKDLVLPRESARRTLYDRALSTLKGRLGVKPPPRS